MTWTYNINLKQLGMGVGQKKRKSSTNNNVQSSHRSSHYYWQLTKLKKIVHYIPIIFYLKNFLFLMSLLLVSPSPMIPEISVSSYYVQILGQRIPITSRPEPYDDCYNFGCSNFILSRDWHEWNIFHIISELSSTKIHCQLGINKVFDKLSYEVRFVRLTTLKPDWLRTNRSSHSVVAVRLWISDY